ncbi:hypothetical protein I3842_16G091600 [Carya illinoinensis]|uniref:Uncharacterized protein n=1 Tax=Carya illinoinensis TaxID=32201 RepID=A0A922D9A3_CARIL|nr:hypothetical protein I3842_16G091600 [Carya illinoinensis]
MTGFVLLQRLVFPWRALMMKRMESLGITFQQNRHVFGIQWSKICGSSAQSCYATQIESRLRSN